jgi:Protein of unknown function (DUF2809)
MKLSINRPYLLLTLLLFVTEVLIALFVRDQFVRPFVGDFLVVILIYVFLQSFWKLPVIPTAIGVLLFAFVVETLQYFHIVEVLHLQHSQFARVVIGTEFKWEDLVAYTAGVACVVAVEAWHGRLKAG